jgi:predicted TIM-barrel fold metal-dependent hydrolase
MVADLCPNLFLDTSSSNSWMKYQEPGCTLHSVLTRALAIAGPRRLLFGTDSSFFPRGWNRAIFDVQASVLQDLGVSAADAALIFGGNLRRITSPGEAGPAAG